jgi:hypothetical protein
LFFNMNPQKKWFTTQLIPRKEKELIFLYQQINKVQQYIQRPKILPIFTELMADIFGIWQLNLQYNSYKFIS